MTDDAVSRALLVDLYELTMADVYRREGIAGEPATFSLFVRALPASRGYLVAAGLDAALDWLEHLHFGPAELAAIDRLGIFGDEFLDWLADLRFHGTVRAVPEGTIVFSQEPILEVDAPIATAQLAETFLLNQITFQTTLATKAARLRHAAGDRAVTDFALRRTQGIDAGMHVARSCRLVGLPATSNVAGALRYGLEAAGTMAHSFVQAHPDEMEAFRIFVRALADAAVLLVDTYDPVLGIERAVAVAAEARARGVNVAGIRIDSGDLATLARYARRRLDDEGLASVRIYASGGLDEYRIDELVHEAHAPIDGFGVGAALGVSDDAPVLDTAYKLVAFRGRPVRKTSPGKVTYPGPKQVWRAEDWSGDTLALADEPPPAGRVRPLLAPVLHDGVRVGAGAHDLAQARSHFEREWRELPEQLKDLREPPRHHVALSTRLEELVHTLDAEHEPHEPTIARAEGGEARSS
ncbi:MAG TPA: nicotinate phosphoribosyltransferase [Acidimicrobiales bacterium]|nr:nicotinate phosphoribosyltransferase [Acidimicrobiales bacterium]